jgi:hypothetical protein
MVMYVMNFQLSLFKMQLVQIAFTRQAAPGNECTISRCMLLPQPKSLWTPWIFYCSSLNINQYMLVIIKLQIIVMVYKRWCFACMLIALSDVYRESLPKLVVSLAALIDVIKDTVVSISVQLVNGIKKPSRSINR